MQFQLNPEQQLLQDKSRYPKAFHKLNELMDTCYVFKGNFQLVSDIRSKVIRKPKSKA